MISEHNNMLYIIDIKMKNMMEIIEICKMTDLPNK